MVFPGGLLDQCQQPMLSVIVDMVLNKNHCPICDCGAWPEQDARTVVEPDKSRDSCLFNAFKQLVSEGHVHSITFLIEVIVKAWLFQLRCRNPAPARSRPAVCLD
jgi:hypothetical protein